MKKILITVCMIAAFAMCATAQQYDKKDKKAKQKERTEQQDEMETSDSEQTDAAKPMPDIEVVDDKEGPNNEIVYKFLGELYYVDREQKKFVKIDRKDLKDSKHEVVVHEGTATRESSKDRSKKSKG